MLADRIKMGSGKRGQPLSNLNVGDKIKFGRYKVESEAAKEIIWVVAAKNHICTPAYPENSVTLIAEKIIDLRAFDAKEPSNPISGRIGDGNNYYSVSNIDQWLNKDSAAGAWYAAAHAYDSPPNTSESVNNQNTQYSSKAGFMHLFTSAEKTAIQNTTIRTVKSPLDGGGSEDIVRKIFLPSTTEVGLANEGGIAEGAKLNLFSNDASRVSYLTQQAFDNTLSAAKPATIGSGWIWWLRTASAVSNTTYIRTVTASGVLGSTMPCWGRFGFRPALNISASRAVSNEVDTDGCYTLA